MWFSGCLTVFILGYNFVLKNKIWCWWLCISTQQRPVCHHIHANTVWPIRMNTSENMLPTWRLTRWGRVLICSWESIAVSKGIPSEKVPVVVKHSLYRSNTVKQENDISKQIWEDVCLEKGATVHRSCSSPCLRPSSPQVVQTTKSVMQGQKCGCT